MRQGKWFPAIPVWSGTERGELGIRASISIAPIIPRMGSSYLRETTPVFCSFGLSGAKDEA